VAVRSRLLAAGHSYLILAKHSFRRSSSERTCVSMASCNASVPLLDNSADAFLSRFCFQSRIACLVALWASDVALRYAFMQASAIEQVLHSWAAAAFETSKIRVAATTFIVFPRYWPPADVLLGGACLQRWPQTHANESAKQVMGAQFRGMPCLLFYVLRFVNTSGENVTVLNERARRRAAGRAEWFSQVGKPLQSDELFTT